MASKVLRGGKYTRVACLTETICVTPRAGSDRLLGTLVEADAPRAMQSEKHHPAHHGESLEKVVLVEVDEPVMNRPKWVPEACVRYLSVAQSWRVASGDADMKQLDTLKIATSNKADLRHPAPPTRLALHKCFRLFRLVTRGGWGFDQLLF